MEKSKRQMMNMPGAAAAGKLPGKLTPLTGTKGWENRRLSQKRYYEISPLLLWIINRKS